MTETNTPNWPSQSEQRNFKRANREGVVRVAPHFRPEEHFWAPIANISEGGLFFCSPVRVELDEPLRLLIHFEGGPQIAALGRAIRWEKGQGCGCSFLAVDSRDKSPFTQWIDPDPTPPDVEFAAEPGDGTLGR